MPAARTDTHMHTSAHAHMHIHTQTQTHIQSDECTASNGVCTANRDVQLIEVCVCVCARVCACGLNANNMVTWCSVQLIDRGIEH